MPASQHEHCVTLDPVPDQVGVDNRQFPIPARHQTAAFGMVGQGGGGRDQAPAEPSRRAGIELFDVGVNAVEVGDGLGGPDYSPHFGRGSGLDVPQEANQRSIAALETTRPAA